jgi:hypothetical protein
MNTNIAFIEIPIAIVIGCPVFMPHQNNATLPTCTGAALDSFTVGFDGEQWRDGGNTTAQTMVLEYGFGSAFNAVSS